MLIRDVGLQLYSLHELTGRGFPGYGGKGGPDGLPGR